MVKLMPRWDQGQREMGKGSSLPSGIQCGVDVMAQTEQPLTKRAVSQAMLGHQYQF